MTRYQGSDDAMVVVQRIARRVSNLERANPLNFGTIDDGGLTVYYNELGTIFIGHDDTVFGGSYFDGFFVYDPFTFATPEDPLAGPWIAAFYSEGDTEQTWAQIGQSDAKVDGFIVNADVARFGWPDPGEMLNQFFVNSQYILLQRGNDSDPDDSKIWLNDSTGIVQVEAKENIQLVTNSSEIGLYGLPTTASAANIFLGTVGGKWTLALVTSSLKYKQDIQDAVVDPMQVLSLAPRTWRDKNDVAAEEAGTLVPKNPRKPEKVKRDKDKSKDRGRRRTEQVVETVAEEVVPEEELIPFKAPRHTGLIAEELNEQQTLRQFVNYDEDGNPDGIAYDRFAAVGLLAVCKNQQEQIDALKAENVAMKKRLDAIEKVLPQLGARP